MIHSLFSTALLDFILFNFVKFSLIIGCFFYWLFFLLCKHWKRPWCWERLKVGGEEDRGWEAKAASPTQWTWIWASSRRWWRTGKPDVLRSMGPQRVGHNWVTEQQQLQHYDIVKIILNTFLIYNFKQTQHHWNRLQNNFALGDGSLLESYLLVV